MVVVLTAWSASQGWLVVDRVPVWMVVWSGSWRWACRSGWVVGLRPRVVGLLVVVGLSQ